jgi:hypothetical protein
MLPNFQVLLDFLHGATMISKAQLFYFVHTEKLVYRSDATGKWVYLKAVSGGGRGQRINNIAYPYGINDARMFTARSEREKPSGDHRGGPIPQGNYSVTLPKQNNFGTSKDPHMVMSCKLMPMNNAMYDRLNFFIHGQGAKGSDGCIVPIDGHVHEVFRLVTKHGGGLLSVETTERHGVDYDTHWAAKGLV